MVQSIDSLNYGYAYDNVYPVKRDHSFRNSALTFGAGAVAGGTLGYLLKGSGAEKAIQNVAGQAASVTGQAANVAQEGAANLIAGGEKTGFFSKIGNFFSEKYTGAKDYLTPKFKSAKDFVVENYNKVGKSIKDYFTVAEGETGFKKTISDFINNPNTKKYGKYVGIGAAVIAGVALLAHIFGGHKDETV